MQITSRSIPTRLTPAARTRDLNPYRPSKPRGPIDLWLDANEGPPTESRLAKTVQCIESETIRRYPDSSSLESRIADSLSVDRSRVLVTAGGDDAINRICLAMLETGRALVQHAPTFTMIEHSARLAGAEVRSVPWKHGPFPLARFREELQDGVALVSIVSPNNPTGRVVETEDIRCLAARAREVGALVMVDLAYAGFAESDPTTKLLELDNVVIVRTLSKALSMAGLRVGYLTGPEPILEWCRATGGPFPVSGVSLAMASAVMEEDTSRLGVIARVRRERSLLTDVLRNAGAEPIDSQANFVLADFPSREQAQWVRDALAGLAIGVRSFTGPALDRALRITCPGDAGAFERLQHALGCATRPEAILFDLDGVIADVSRSYREAVRKTVEHFGASVSLEEIGRAKREGDANNDWILSQRLLARRGIHRSLEDVTGRFENLYQGANKDDGLWRTETTLMSRTTLEMIAGRFPIGIVTGRPRRDAERFLEHAGISDLFSTVVCMEDGASKPSPDVVQLALERLGVRRAWMIGDTVDDVRASRAAGAVPIGMVPPGDEPDETADALLQAGASRILPSIEVILEMLP